MILTKELVYQYISVAEDILHECFTEYVSPVISDITFTTARSYWANVRLVSPSSFMIRISRCMEEIENFELFQTRLTSCMIHELIHTQKGCMNHGKKFQKIAALVNQKYPQYEIGTGTSGEKYGVADLPRPDKYIVRCKNCGAETRYKKKTQAVTNPKQFICCKCNRSKLEVIKL